MEFTRWLRRRQISFGESLPFAINAWQSMDFSYANKYEEIVDWLATILREQKADSSFPAVTFRELLKLRLQPGLVPTTIKIKFINELLALAAQASAENARTFAELINCLIRNEWVQDIYRADFNLLAEAYMILFNCYSTYLRQPNIKVYAEVEIEFFKGVVQFLKDFVKRIHHIENFEAIYRCKLIQPLIEVILLSRLHDLSLFDELVDLEQLLTRMQSSETMILRLVTLPLHVQLVALECTLFNRRGDIQFLILLLDSIFATQYLTKNSPKLKLTISAFLLVAMRNHTISMDFEWKNSPAVALVAKEILKNICLYKDMHLREVLILVNSALELNPFLLEENIFHIMTWLVVAPKQTIEEQRLFEKFLVLAINVFQCLSRAERFLINFLKVFKEWLSKHKLSDKHWCKIVKPTDLASTPSFKIKKAKSGKTMSSDYVDIIFKNSKFSTFEDTNQVLKKQVPIDESFSELKTLWPSGTAGIAFSKLVANLMIKPSMVIWKTLLYSFRDLLENTATNILNTNIIVNIELHATLLCQYFNGSRIIEHVQNCYENLNILLEHTRQLLKQFGNFLLKREHNHRTIKALLELTYYSTAFELLLTYYVADGITASNILMHKSIEKIHGCLSDNEWKLIKQRFINFETNNSSNDLFNRLENQRLVAEQLIHSKPLTQIETTKKSAIRINNFEENLSTEYLAALRCFESYYQALASSEMNEFLSIALNKITLSHANIEKYLEAMIDTINMHNKIKKLSPTRLFVLSMPKVLQRLRLFPVAFLRSEQKFDIFLRLLALYNDALAVQDYIVANDAVEFIFDFMILGDRMPILKYFTISQLLMLLPIRNCFRFYEIIFGTYIPQSEKSCALFFNSLESMLQSNVLVMGLKLSEEHRQILFLAINTFANLSRLSETSVLHNHSKKLLNIYASYLDAHFSQILNNEQDVDFVQLTIPSFVHYIKSTISKSNMDKCPELVSMDFKRISKIYITHTLNYRNVDNLRLITIALIHQQVLDLQEEIEFVLSGYWYQICEDLNSSKSLSSLKCMSSALKLIINNKSNEDLLLILRELNTKAKSVSEKDERGLKNVLYLLGLIAKCSFTSIKGSIFNEQFKLITANILLRFNRSERLFLDSTLVLEMLITQQAIVNNRSVPMSSDNIDSIIEFVQNINIKKYSKKDESLQDLNQLHSAMTGLCSALLKSKKMFLIERVPQIMNIFKELLQAIVWYKNERLNDADISAMEVSVLAERAHNLANLMKIIKIQNVAMKRIAPFLLLFVINLMAANKRPTTLYPQIKIHIENICYVLIGICDRRMGHFVMRNSNEAGRQVYELLYKQYKKYRFSGKV